MKVEVRSFHIGSRFEQSGLVNLTFEDAEPIDQADFTRLLPEHLINWEKTADRRVYYGAKPNPGTDQPQYHAQQ